MRRFGCFIAAVSIVAAACAGADAGDETPADASAPQATATIVSSTSLPQVATTQPVGPVDATDGTLPLADEAMDDPEVTTVATDLAPSQVTATTVPRPPTPPECTGDQVELWTARVVENTNGTVDAVIRVRNSGGVWCEPDIGRSPLIDPNVEPDVWLEPGQTADLVVGQMDTDCENPALVTLIQVGIGTDSIVVPSAVVTCGWWLTAFYPNDPVPGPCQPDQLDIEVADAVFVRNASTTPCLVPRIVSVGGADGSGWPEGAPEVAQLWPGDVVVWGVSSSSSCDEPDRTVELSIVQFVGATSILNIDDVPCDMVFWTGAAAPWFTSDWSPVDDLTVGDVDADAVRQALDPFGDST